MTFRNLLLLSVVFFGLQGTVQAQTVPEVQMPIITKVTATWCTNCGSWGWELFKGLLEDNAEKAIFLSTHNSGDLVTPAASDFASNLGANGQPIFYFNNTNTLATANTVASKRMEIAQMVDDANLLTPTANTGLEFTLTDNTYNIKTKTKFFSGMNGNIHLSIVALESKLLNFQAAQGTIEHTYVIRGSESSNAFGPMIASGAIDGGTEIDGTYTLEKGANWNADNITLVALMWSEDNDNFTYINGSVGAVAVVNGLDTDLGSDFTAQWRTNDIENELFINTNADLGQTNVNLYNVNGQLVNQIFSGEMISGEYHLPVAGVGTGKYFF